MRKPANAVGYLVREGLTIKPHPVQACESTDAVRPECATSTLAEAIFRVLLPDTTRKEHFCVAYLDSRLRLMQAEIISIGTLTAALVHPREVFRPAVEMGAASLMLCHNHPSGDPEPSAEDLALTRRIRQAGDILGIELVDHLILGKTRHVSLKELGYL